MDLQTVGQATPPADPVPVSPGPYEKDIAPEGPLLQG